MLGATHPHLVKSEGERYRLSLERMKQIASTAYAMGRDMIWPATAKHYIESFERARVDHKAMPCAAFAGWTLDSRPYALPPLRLDHVVRMSDNTGIFQHAIFNAPNFHEGYCTDDNARAFILSCLLEQVGGQPPNENLNQHATTYIAFLAAAFDYNSGRFRNFMSHGRQWLEDAGSEDSHARALWALGTGAGRSHNQGHSRLAAQLFEHGLPAVETFTSPRAWSFALLGINEYVRQFENRLWINTMRETLTGKLVALWHDCSTEQWPWLEPYVTYDNARICQALILDGKWQAQGEALQIGLKSLRRLISIQKGKNECFRPIGSNGFYQRDGERADFDQQPVEAQAMVSACHEAFRLSSDPMWPLEAKRAFEWFLGRNDLGLPLYDFNTGGCSDGLHEERISENQGAESTLAFHLALAEMNSAEHWISPPPIPAP